MVLIIQVYIMGIEILYKFLSIFFFLSLLHHFSHLAVHSFPSLLISHLKVYLTSGLLLKNSVTAENLVQATSP